MKKLLKKLQYILEAIAVYPFFIIFSLLPRKVAGAIMAKIVSFIGQFHSTNQVAIDNIKRAFPELSDEEVKTIAKKAWENLGRTAGEFPHVTRTTDKDLHKIAEGNFKELSDKLRETSNSVIYLSAHIGNWELASRFLLNVNHETALIYRKAKNPLVERLIRSTRDKYADKIFSKGEKAGFREMVKHFKEGGSIGMLADQHLTGGAEVTFFGRKVKAPKTPAELAKKFNIPILMSRIICLENGEYKMQVEEPISDTKDCSVEGITQEIYHTYEKWIKETPEQWFWMHKRWRK